MGHCGTPRTRPWLRLYKNDRNRGSGYNTKRAISLATKDYLFWQTVDWAYDIRYLAQSLNELSLSTCSKAFAKERFRRGEWSTSVPTTAYKGFVSVVNYRLIRLCSVCRCTIIKTSRSILVRLIQSVTLETESAFTNPECLLENMVARCNLQGSAGTLPEAPPGAQKGNTAAAQFVAAIHDILKWWIQWMVLGRRTDRGRGRVLQ